MPERNMNRPALFFVSLMLAVGIYFHQKHQRQIKKPIIVSETDSEKILKACEDNLVSLIQHKGSDSKLTGLCLYVVKNKEKILNLKE